MCWKILGKTVSELASRNSYKAFVVKDVDFLSQNSLVSFFLHRRVGFE